MILLKIVFISVLGSVILLIETVNPLVLEFWNNFIFVILDNRHEFIQKFYHINHALGIAIMIFFLEYIFCSFWNGCSLKSHLFSFVITAIIFYKSHFWKPTFISHFLFSESGVLSWFLRKLTSRKPTYNPLLLNKKWDF